MNTITYIHNKTLITYDEPANKWRFTLRGRDRSADSLSDAKEAIDKPVPKSEEKPFTPVEAWNCDYSEISKVTITGIAEPPHFSSDLHVWIKDSKGDRGKKRVPYAIYASTTSNDAKALAILKKNEQIATLQREILDLREGMTEFTAEIPE